MDITKISAGHDVPNDLNVVIEISQGGQPIKYEITDQIFKHFARHLECPVWLYQLCRALTALPF